MAEDRLQDLLGGVVPPDGGSTTERVAATANQPISSSLAEFQEVKATLDSVGASIEKLRDGYAVLSSTAFDRDKLEAQLTAHADSAKEGLAAAVTRLQTTEATLDAEASTLEHNGQQISVAHRMRRKGWLANNVQLAALTGRLLEVQEDGVKQRKEDARRQYRITMPAATDEEIDAALQTKWSTPVMQRKVSMLGQYAERVQQLEQAIEELFQQTLILATVVDQNGALFDSIEANVDACNEYVKQAVDEYLPEATRHATAARKKQARANPSASCHANQECNHHQLLARPRNRRVLHWLNLVCFAGSLECAGRSAGASGCIICRGRGIIPAARFDCRRRTGCWVGLDRGKRTRRRHHQRGQESSCGGG
jgi:t-SNARE complex subunit (syntaxin)